MVSKSRESTCIAGAKTSGTNLPFNANGGRAAGSAALPPAMETCAKVGSGRLAGIQEG